MFDNKPADLEWRYQKDNKINILFFHYRPWMSSNYYQSKILRDFFLVDLKSPVEQDGLEERLAASTALGKGALQKYVYSI